MITPDQFKQLFPRLSDERCAVYLPALTTAIERYEINMALRVAAFCAQISHESAGLTKWEENLNYSASRLTQVWPKRFPTIAAAQPYARNPQALANKVYANRMGNGDEASGDGWNYRGRAPIQATGKDMYRRISAAIQIDVLTNPDLLLQPDVGFLATAWIWAVEKKLNLLADKQDIRTITKRINGGYTGLAERQALFERAKRILI